MKIKFTVLMLVLAFNFEGCKKDKNDGLTPETQTGANTFSCKINGAIFSPQQALFGPIPLSSRIDTFNGSNTLSISASNENTLITNMHFQINDFKGVGTYNLDAAKDVYIDCYLKVPSPNLERSVNGIVQITKSQGKIVSGTFEFNFLHGSENINVTSGRFDLTLK